MKNYIYKSISVMLVITMSVYCFAGCGAKTNNNEKTIKKSSVAESADLEALLTSKVGSAKDTDKNETVYIEMKADGTVTKTTVSNVLKVSGKDNISDYSDLNDITNIGGNEKFAKDDKGNLVWENKGENIKYQGTTTETAPIEIGVTYYLDGEEISAKDLAGKSGKVKIVYDYKNQTKESEGEFVPFLVLTGMVLDTDKFSNIEVENGKVVGNDGNDIVIGYAAPGLKDELLTNIGNAEDYIGEIEIPNTFTVTADVKDFELEMTLSMTTSKIGDMDLKEALDFSDIESQMDELQDGADRIVDGSKDLNNGAGELRTGVVKLKSGAQELTRYMKQLYSGTGKLNNQYTVFNKALLSGLKTANSGAKQIYDGAKEVESAAMAVNGGSEELESAATAINSGSKELESVAAAVDPGAKELESAAGTVDAGGKQLAEGISTAKSAFEDVTKADGTKKSQGLNNGAKDISEGAKNANEGVKEVVGTLQSAPKSIEKQIDAVIEQVKAATGGAISSKAELNATVEGINTAVKNGMELSVVLANNHLNTEAYYSLVQAYYSIQTLEKVKISFNNQINESAEEIKELLTGMNTLQSGTEALSGGINQVYEGLKQLDTGASTLVSGTGAIKKGMGSLTQGTAGLKTGTSQMAEATASLQTGTKTLSKGTAALKSGATDLKKAMKQLSSGASTLNTKIGDASPKIKTAISQINTATKKINGGTGTLSEGTTELNQGIISLADGTKQLKDGTIELNEEGIKKITDIFGKDAEQAVDAIQNILNKGKEYKSFSGISKDMSGEVKFIYKTEEIKADK